MVVTPAQEKKKTVKFSILFSILLSVSIIAIIMYFTITPETMDYLFTTQIRYEFFLLAAVFNVFGWTLWGLRLKVLSNAIESSFNISLKESTKIVIANLFLANITPSMAGGEPVRIYLLNKNGLGVGCATAATIGERLLDAIFFLLCVPFAFFIFGSYLTNQYLKIGLFIAVLVFIIFVILFIITIQQPKKIKSFIIRIIAFFKKIRRKEKPSRCT